ncbi:MAG: hypothetical protein V1773_06685 [bacterium]
MKILNMKTLIGLFFFILCFNNNYAQDEKTESDSTYIIELKEFYDGKGIVFGRDKANPAHHDSTDQCLPIAGKHVNLSKLIHVMQPHFRGLKPV